MAEGGEVEGQWVGEEGLEEVLDEDWGWLVKSCKNGWGTLQRLEMVIIYGTPKRSLMRSITVPVGGPAIVAV